MYSKRAGTSSIRGHLYATKLMSLLYFRALHDDAIEEFHLASNLDNIGAFNNICIRAQVKGLQRPVAVFIQARHRDNERQTLRHELAASFDSYLTIRNTFQPDAKDFIFNGTFDDTECLFVVYTTARSDASVTEPAASGFCSKLNDLIATCQLSPGQTASTVPVSGGTAMQPRARHESVQFLCKLVVKQQVAALAEHIARCMHEAGERYQALLSDELTQRYHVVLAQTVFHISKTQPDGHRVATIRQDFFDTNDEYLILFKDALFKEILKRRAIDPADVNKLLSDFSAEPTDATKLSQVIGTVVIYNNGQLEYDRRYTKDFRPQLNKYVSRSTVNRAMELAAKDILLHRQFLVPAEFGNRDLTIGGSDEQKEKRLNHLALEIIDLLDKCDSSKIVTIDDSLESGFLQHSGDLASAVGNIFVLDDNTKLIKITDNKDSLEDLARRLYELLELNDKIHTIHEYRFCVKVNKFPKLSFDFSEYEKNLARDFLNKLTFYCSQANENGVEAFLKGEIAEYQRDHPDYYQVRADAIFLKYHDEIQKWWMQPKQEASYLTRDCDLFQHAINNIIEELLMSSIHATYMNKLKHYNHTFSDDAVRSLNLQEQHSSTVIITENTALTVVKVMQYLHKKQHVVLDLEYLVSLPPNDRNALRTELKNTRKILIFVCDTPRHARNEKKTLENIAEAIQEKETIVITNNVKSFEMLKKYKFPNAANIVRDEKNSLVDLSEESRSRLVERATVMFQGIEVRLDLILDDESRSYVKGDVLNKIIREETITVGAPLPTSRYQDMKHSYIDRRLKNAGEVDIHVTTLMDDRKEDVVLVTAAPGMGKSTLLTHLSLKTKELKPEVWIVRINLLEHSRQFGTWQEEQAPVDLLQSLQFMCRVILGDKLGDGTNVDIELEGDDDGVRLARCAADQCAEFQLNLFLHLYNKRKLIFLFDGFDEISPHYTHEVITLLKIVSSGPLKQRLWVTSRPYSDVQATLQRHFGSPYQLDYFSHVETQKFLETFWERNLRVDELDSEQLHNVHNFMEHVSTLTDVKLLGFAKQLHRVYVNAALYLSSEIRYRHIPLWKYKTHYDQLFCFPAKDLTSGLHTDHDGNPLHLLLAAAFVESNIRRVQDGHVWSVEHDTFSFYERFLETKMKTIRFQDKSELNICIPDVIITCDKELITYSSKHRKLAAYATFRLHRHQLFSADDLQEIKQMIRFIELGGDKTGLIDDVADGVPVSILTDYFAVEYLCDCLKRANDDSEKLATLIDFILNVIFSTETFANIRNVFDYKIKHDRTLLSILEENDKVIFNFIMRGGQGDAGHSADTCAGTHAGLSSTAVTQQLNNFIQLLVKTLEHHIDSTNITDFLDIAKASHLLSSACTYKNEILLCSVLEIVRHIDECMYRRVLRAHLPCLSDSTIRSYVGLSTQQAVQRLFVDEDCVQL